MNKKYLPGVLFIFTIFVSAVYTNLVFADTPAKLSAARVSNTIVISQVYGGGGSNTAGPTYKSDYIELFNLSGAPVSLNGLALQYGSATGQFGSAATLIFALPNVTLQPGQHYLIQTGTVGTAGLDLPVTPDVITTGLSMAAAGGKVALTNTTTALACGATATPCTLPDSRIVDLVAYGTSNNGEGGVSVNNGAAFTNMQGAVRNAGGCTDTDNNNNDLTVVTNPVPRNLATTATPCGGGVLRGALYDFTGNGTTDWITLSAANAAAPLRWSVLGNPANPAPGQAFIRQFDYGFGGDSITPGDFTGDGKTELGVWRSGTYYISQFPTGSGAITLERAFQWGQTGDAVGRDGDYDGDGKMDFTVVRTISGVSTWYILNSINNTIKTIQFGGTPAGTSTFRFPGADFNGDGRDELVISNVNNSTSAITWYFGDSNTGAGIAVIPWGNFTTDFAVAPDDYTGDGKADLIVVRESASPAVWYVRNSATGGAAATQFGIGDPTFANSDLPVRGDYDGDGRHDIAVYRRSNSTFYVLRSSTGTILGQQWGSVGDTPLANFFVF